MLTKTGFPAARAVTLEEAKAHLRVDHALEDTLIGAYLGAAIEGCAAFAGRAFDQQTYRLTLDTWPPYPNSWSLWAPYICIPIAPIVSVASLNYYDEDGDVQQLGYDDWYLHRTPEGGVILWTEGVSLPTLRGQAGDVFVDLEAGYDPPDASGVDPEFALPDAARAAILLTTGHLYANRETVIVGKTATDLPQGARALLSQIRIYR